MIQARLRGADYRNVTLLDSPFRSQRDETIALYLEHPSNDDILHRYRLRAGIPSHVDGMVGWGPSIGQYLGAYAKWYSNTRDQRIYDKAMDLFHGWAECVEKNEDLLDCGTYVWEKFLGGFLDMIDASKGLAPGDPEAMASRIIESVNQEPAPKHIALGSQALRQILEELSSRLAGYCSQIELAASTDVKE